jgi:hypothetical protein
VLEVDPLYRRAGHPNGAACLEAALFTTLDRPERGALQTLPGVESAAGIAAASM